MNRKRFRWLVILGFGFTSLLIAIAYLQFYIARPIGSGPAGPKVSRAPFEKTWTDRRVLLLGIGDSITAGLGAKSTSHSYFQRLITNPTDEFEDMKGVCLSRVLPNL